jgi:hypothetical protein
MPAYEDTTRRAIAENLGISERMSQAVYDATEVGPKSEDLAVYEEGFGGDECAGGQVEHLAAVLVLFEPWPAMGPKVGRTGGQPSCLSPGSLL